MQLPRPRRYQCAVYISRLRARIVVATFVVCIAGQGFAAISPTGNVVPAYPASAPDPWNVTDPSSNMPTELVVGSTATGTLSVAGGSDITSVGGTIAFNPNVVATAT